MRRYAAILALLLLAIVTAPLARAGTPDQDLAWLNAKRVANGIPGDITLNPDWSAQCAQHIAYMKATNTVSHTEDPANPNYTETGNWAGTHAVLASGYTWTESSFIWEAAPLHLSQLLTPQLAQVGIADDGQYVCVTTWPGYTRPTPPADSVLTYPGNGTSIYASESAQEWPITPNQALGVANPTGPHLYVYAWGPSVLTGITPDGLPIRITAATLRGPNGKVPVKWADPMNPVLGRYLTDASGIIIPVVPLQDNAQYRASVTFSNGVAYAWGFNTQVNPEDLAFRDVHFAVRRTSRKRTCTHHHPRGCVRWRTRYVEQIAVQGRFVDDDDDTEGRAAYLGVSFNDIEQAQVPISASGDFTAAYTFQSTKRRFTLLVTLTAGDDVAAYLVRFRIVNHGRRPVAVVYGVERAPSGTGRSMLTLPLPPRLH